MLVGAYQRCAHCAGRPPVPRNTQGVLGRNALEGVLRTLGVLAAGEKLPDTLPAVREGRRAGACTAARCCLTALVPAAC